MHSLFFKNSDVVDIKKYDFIPVKNDETDEQTQSLFEQLEEGAQYFTDIYGSVKAGANLYAKQTKDGNYGSCLPIHVAAYNVGCNTEAMGLLLQTFNDPEERKRYIFTKDDGEKNALEILIENAGIEEGIAIPSILAILSFLTEEEQRELMTSLSSNAMEIIKSDEGNASREEDIRDFSDLNDYFFIRQQTINMCKQRRDEAAKVYADYDSDEESLGQLNFVDNKKFTAKVTYRETLVNGITVSTPELMLIPSDWRLETAISNNQGDHVTAYVLLLSSFSHCKGENVKNLPFLVCQLAKNVLPDSYELFLAAKQQNDATLMEYRDKRVQAIGYLRAHVDNNEALINATENNLKKAEIELIARHIEDSIDRFISITNQLQDESFAQERKSSLTTKYILEQLAKIVESVPFLEEKKYTIFKVIIKQAIAEEAIKYNRQKTGVTDAILKNIAVSALKKGLKNTSFPREVLSNSGKLTQASLIAFLKDYTPCKKYHEGYAIKDIKENVAALKKTNELSRRSQWLGLIAYHCFKLFDYPRVNDDALNDVTVLYQAIPRHLIIIQAAFSYLKDLPVAEKRQLYDTFLGYILSFQLWNKQVVSNSAGGMVPLNVGLLKEKTLEYADLDEDHNFSMKAQLPVAIHSLTLD